jgi:DNA-binding transcriptional MerR regulator
MPAYTTCSINPFHCFLIVLTVIQANMTVNLTVKHDSATMIAAKGNPMENVDYSIQELCDRTGLPRRTIHFYSQQGLLPPPQGAGLGARYGWQHLLRLQLIPYMRKQGLRLDQIRVKFEKASLEELEQMNAQIDLAPAPQASDPLRLFEKNRPETSARAYQHYVLSDGITLVVPAGISSTNKQKLNDLLDAARRIFGDGTGENLSTPLTETKSE